MSSAHAEGQATIVGIIGSIGDRTIALDIPTKAGIVKQRDAKAGRSCRPRTFAEILSHDRAENSSRLADVLGVGSDVIGLEIKCRGPSHHDAVIDCGRRSQLHQISARGEGHKSFDRRPDILKSGSRCKHGAAGIQQLDRRNHRGSGIAIGHRNGRSLTRS